MILVTTTTTLKLNFGLCLPFSAVLSRIYALFSAPFTDLNSAVVPKNWQIPGMVQSITSSLTRECKCRILRIVGGGVLWVLSIQYFGPQAPPLLVHHSPSYVPRVNFAVRSGVRIASVVNITWPVRTCPSIFTTRPICTSAQPKSIQFAQCFVWAPYYKYTL